MNERPCGRLGQHTISHCADKAAHIIGEYSIPRAVCLSPEGQVTVENPEHAIPEELVGVYSTGGSHFELWRWISDDLLEAKTQRGVTGGTNHRHRVPNSVRRVA